MRPVRSATALTYVQDFMQKYSFKYNVWARAARLPDKPQPKTKQICTQVKEKKMENQKSDEKNKPHTNPLIGDIFNTGDSLWHGQMISKLKLPHAKNSIVNDIQLKHCCVIGSKLIALGKRA